MTPSALTDAAAEAAARGDLDSALSLVRHALSQAPESVPALICLGNVLAECGDASAAATAYGVALQAAPHSFEAHANAGLLASEQPGRRAAAAAHLRAALAINPRWVDGCYNLGNLLAGPGSTTAEKLEAIRMYERALALAPDDVDVLCNLTDCLNDLALFERGEAVAAEAARRHPTHAGAAKRHALLLMQRGRHDEALAAARAAAARDAAAGRDPDHETLALPAGYFLKSGPRLGAPQPLPPLPLPPTPGTAGSGWRPALCRALCDHMRPACSPVRLQPAALLQVTACSATACYSLQPHVLKPAALHVTGTTGRLATPLRLATRRAGAAAGSAPS